MRLWLARQAPGPSREEWPAPSWAAAMAAYDAISRSNGKNQIRASSLSEASLRSPMRQPGSLTGFGEKVIRQLDDLDVLQTLRLAATFDPRRQASVVTPNLELNSMPRSFPLPCTLASPGLCAARRPVSRVSAAHRPRPEAAGLPPVGPAAGAAQEGRRAKARMPCELKLRGKAPRKVSCALDRPSATGQSSTGSCRAIGWHRRHSSRGTLIPTRPYRARRMRKPPAEVAPLGAPAPVRLIARQYGN